MKNAVVYVLFICCVCFFLLPGQIVVSCEYKDECIYKPENCLLVSILYMHVNIKTNCMYECHDDTF
jgi:hypothetical protein